MNPDYHDAANRHWEDATFLLDDRRFANADHLLGVSSECALKAVMLALGMLMKGGRPADRRHGHIDVLWDEFLTFANSRGGVRYASMLSPTSNPFDNWKVDQRYDERSAFSEPIVVAHEAGARLTMSVLQSAVLDGVIQ